MAGGSKGKSADCAAIVLASGGWSRQTAVMHLMVMGIVWLVGAAFLFVMAAEPKPAYPQGSGILGEDWSEGSTIVR